jgi:hypothetical protein
MRRALGILFISTTALFAPSCRSIAPSSPDSITPVDAPVGKWLAAISIGGGAPDRATLALRDTLAPRFTSDQGGRYELAINMSDVPDSGSMADPTRSNIVAAFGSLKETIATWRREHPQGEAQVIVLLTGHGFHSEDNVFLFTAADGDFTGAQLAEMIHTLDADETIVILQSCKSGALASRVVTPHAEESSSFDRLADTILATVNSRGRRIAIMTPTNQYVSSPLGLWEYEILGPSLSSEGDLDRNGVITWLEWKDFIRAKACHHPSFAPQVLFERPHAITPATLARGIDPQIRERGMGRDLGILLSPDLATRWAQQTLEVPAHGAPLSGFSPETMEFCENRARLLDTLFDTAGDAMAPLLLSLDEGQRVSALAHMTLYRAHYPVTAALGSSLERLSREAPAEVVNEVVSFIRVTGTREGSNRHIDRLFGLWKDSLESYPVRLQINVIRAFRFLAVRSSRALLTRLASESSDKNVRDEARVALEAL